MIDCNNKKQETATKNNIDKNDFARKARPKQTL